MRRKNTETLGEVLQRYLRALNVDKKLMEVQVIRQWPQYVGQTVAAATSRLYMDRGVLFVQLQSSVVRHELSRIKEPLRESINRQLGQEVVREIVLR